MRYYVVHFPFQSSILKYNLYIIFYCGFYTADHPPFFTAHTSHKRSDVDSRYDELSYYVDTLLIKYIKYDDEFVEDQCRNIPLLQFPL